jgi:hypothetical protein
LLTQRNRLHVLGRPVEAALAALRGVDPDQPDPDDIPIGQPSVECVAVNYMGHYCRDRRLGHRRNGDEHWRRNGQARARLTMRTNVNPFRHGRHRFGGTRLERDRRSPNP